MEDLKMSKFSTYLDLAESHAFWLKLSPRKRLVRIESDAGVKAILYWNDLEQNKGSFEGVTLQMEDEQVSLGIYPVNPRFKVISKHETQDEYFSHKRAELSKRS